MKFLICLSLLFWGCSDTGVSSDSNLQEQSSVKTNSSTPNTSSENNTGSSEKSTSQQGNSSSLKENSSSSQNTAPTDFKVIGYFSYWSSQEIASLRWDMYTHINYAFATPKKDGSFSISNSSKLDALLAESQKHSTKIFISLGGAGSHGDFAPLAESAVLTQQFADTLSKFCVKKGIAGIDIDWEDFKAADTPIITSFFQTIATTAHKYNLEVSAALPASSWSAKHVSQEATDSLDWINIMIYDNSGYSWSTKSGPHSDWTFFKTSINYWNTTKNIPLQKLVFGLPFYGRGFGGVTGPNQAKPFLGGGTTKSDGYVDYSAIVSNQKFGYTTVNTDNYSYIFNEDEVIFYDSPELITRKTAYGVSQKAMGMMVWDMTQDYEDQLSKAILAGF